MNGIDSINLFLTGFPNSLGDEKNVALMVDTDIYSDIETNCRLMNWCDFGLLIFHRTLSYSSFFKSQCLDEGVRSDLRVEQPNIANR